MDKRRLVVVLPAGSKAATYWETHSDWIDTDGSLRAMLRDIGSAEGRRDAVRRIRDQHKLSEAFFRALETMVLEVDEEEIDAASLRSAKALLARVSSRDS